MQVSLRLILMLVHILRLKNGQGEAAVNLFRNAAKTIGVALNIRKGLDGIEISDEKFATFSGYDVSSQLMVKLNPVTSVLHRVSSSGSREDRRPSISQGMIGKQLSSPERRQSNCAGIRGIIAKVYF